MADVWHNSYAYALCVTCQPRQDSFTLRHDSSTWDMTDSLVSRDMSHIRHTHMSYVTHQPYTYESWFTLRHDSSTWDMTDSHSNGWRETWLIHIHVSHDLAWHDMSLTPTHTHTRGRKHTHTHTHTTHTNTHTNLSNDGNNRCVWYRVAKTQRMPSVAGHFSQKSH